MRCHAPSTRAPVQAKADSSRLFAPARQLDIKQQPEGARHAALPAGPGAGFSLADVPVHAPPARAPDPAGLPEPLKAGVERLSGFAMDDVRVHRDSPEPARLGALAFAQASDIHLGPGQEQHLPHEAWHVAQQKQGRVTPTQQLAGHPLSDDRALEAEADRIGSSLASALGAPPSQLRSAETPSAGAVQRRIKYHGEIWPSVQPIGSNILREYNNKPELYRLRDDWTYNKPTENIHLIEEDKIYLLGERHDVSEFSQDAAPWTSVLKMCEGMSALPGTDGKYKKLEFAAFSKAGPDEVGFSPLEDTLVTTMNYALLAHSMLNPIAATGTWRSGNYEEDPTNFLNGIVANAREFAWFSKMAGSEPDAGASKAAIVKFGDVLTSEYRPVIFRLQFNLALLAELNKQPSKQRHKWAFTTYLEGIREYRAVLPKIVDGLRPLVGVQNNTAEESSVNASLKPSAKQDPNALAALFGRRDMDMSSAILNKPPPLLVQLGDLHVEGVANMLGPMAYKVHYPQRLQDVSFRGVG